MIAWLDQGFRFGLGCFASENCILIMDRDRGLMTILFVSAGLALVLRFGLSYPVSENCIFMMDHDGVLMTIVFLCLLGLLWSSDLAWAALCQRIAF